MTPEDFINKSHFVSSDFIDTKGNTLGANMSKVYEFAEAYHKAKVKIGWKNFQLRLDKQRKN